MKHFIYPAVLLVAVVSAQAVHADETEIRKCDFEVKARCTSVEARVTLVDSVMKRVEVDVFMCGLPGHPGYRCTIDSSRGDTDATWSDDGHTTVVANTDPFNPTAADRVKVTVGQDVSIDLEEAQSLGRCGAGAELPRTIVIPAHSKICRVQLQEP